MTSILLHHSYFQTTVLQPPHTCSQYFQNISIAILPLDESAYLMIWIALKDSILTFLVVSSIIFPRRLKPFSTSEQKNKTIAYNHFTNIRIYFGIFNLYPPKVNSLWLSFRIKHCLKFVVKIITVYFLLILLLLILSQQSICCNFRESLLVSKVNFATLYLGINCR